MEKGRVECMDDKLRVNFAIQTFALYANKAVSNNNLEKFVIT